jgi:hypothetical protein
MPDGFDFVGGVSAIDPGVTVTVVFLRTLPSARYVMFCGAEGEPPGAPHSEQGEFAEFTIR